MHDFYKLADISYFSSDSSKSTLIFSEKNGTIQMISTNMSHIISDHYKKHIRFYPSDDSCFTTTDNFMGLRVWDGQREAIIYSYQQDCLNGHEYSDSNIVSAACESGLKIYDLRIRYNINALKVPLCKGTLWNKSQIIGFNNEEIYIYNSYSNKILRKITDQNIEDVIVFRDEICYVKKSNNRYFIKKENVGYEIETLGPIIKSVDRDSRAFYVLGNNETEFIEYDHKWIVTFDSLNNIKKYIFTEDNVYLFSNDELYFRESGYENFKDHVKEEGIREKEKLLTKDSP